MEDGSAGHAVRDVTSPAGGAVGIRDPLAGVPGSVLLDAARQPVAVVDEFLRSMAANGSPATTLHSYACVAVAMVAVPHRDRGPWDRAVACEVRDFVLWMRFGSTPSRAGTSAPATINHSLAVLRSFYDERRPLGQGP